MGLEMDRHDALPLHSVAPVSVEDQSAAAAYVARRARDDADRDLLMTVLGLATPTGTVLLAAGSLLLLALGRHIQTGGHHA